MPKPMTSYTAVSRQMAATIPANNDAAEARAYAVSNGIHAYVASKRGGKAIAIQVTEKDGRFYRYCNIMRRTFPVKRADVQFVF